MKIPRARIRRTMPSLQMEKCYEAKRVSLHVRKSNRGAIRLYEQVLGYEVQSVAKGYYSDGEDAYLMQVDLPLKSSSSPGGGAADTLEVMLLGA